MTELFTYIMEFKGGTYTTQVYANALNDSVVAWALQIEKEITEIKLIGNKTVHQIKDLISKEMIDKPTLLTGLENVWYLEIYTRIGVLRINIVKTTL
ncbi:hypothetical protein NF867_13745 [Solitalea sp. MAHUQ-68]|uniref:Uncharacterized protein n=1 Tax=Solitalea agri TaxID=2953739 RepID=A0A9X2FBN7_9SPHI|nr:hypothetical protein [Solitalea agri]MCO4293923.1 hypothetical protein [Solitalea agri]